MKQTFTTGELAKLCNVSVRTVQYYDKENILKPSELSEGGRRIYTEDDLKKFRCICLYKSLGFSLDDIKMVTGSSDTFSLLCDMILRQKGKIKEEILILQQTEQKLIAIQQQIEETGVAKVESINEIDSLMIKKNQHRKTDIMTYVFLGCYLFILCAGFPLAVSVGGIVPVIMSLVAVVLLLGLIWYHSQVNSYICINCHNKFSIGFFKDMFSMNGSKRGKYLKCPNCEYKGWFKESFPE